MMSVTRLPRASTHFNFAAVAQGRPRMIGLGQLHSTIGPGSRFLAAPGPGYLGHRLTSSKPSSCCSPKPTKQAPEVSAYSREFWSSRSTWRRAGVNTFRCLVGCTAGDFSAMWYLQAFHPELGMETVMAISMASGLSTSLLLETVLLRFGRDGLAWKAAAKTAAGMSMISMITMELAENAVDYYLTGGVVQLDSPIFWLAAFVSVVAGFLTPLPYNYHRLRKYGRACH